jgi:hypothetical protein
MGHNCSLYHHYCKSCQRMTQLCNVLKNSHLNCWRSCECNIVLRREREIIRKRYVYSRLEEDGDGNCFICLCFDYKLSFQIALMREIRAFDPHQEQPLIRLHDRPPCNIKISQLTLCVHFILPLLRH